MIICIFGVTYREDYDRELHKQLNADMVEAVCSMPGFISLKFYKADDGEQIGIIRFKTRKDLKTWRNDIAHRGAWGHAPKLYHEFWVQNCETFDDYAWVDGEHLDRDQSDRFQMSRDEVLAAMETDRS